MQNTKTQSPFKDKVLQVVKLIPKGKVMSYGQVALYVGMPRAAREVGWVLNGLPENTDIPWWRVTNNKGVISIKGSRYSQLDQKKLLEKEGIKVDKELAFDISKYRFQPNEGFIDNLKLDPLYLEMLSSKIPFRNNFNK